MGGVIVEPREVRRTIVHERLKGVNQHREGRLFQLPTCLTQRQTPLHPGIALDTRRTQGTLAPQHAKAQGALRPVVGRLNSRLVEKHPQRTQLAP